MLNRLHLALSSGDSVPEATYQWLAQTRNEANRWPSDEEVLEKVSEKPHEMQAQRRDMVLNAIENRLRIDKGLPPLSRKLRAAILIPKGEAGTTNYPIPGGGPTPTRMQRRDAALDMLGNLTLVSSSLKKTQAEARWTEKREYLEDSKQVLLTQALLSPQKDDFTEQDISNRSRWMGHLCIDIWPKIGV